MRSLAETAQSLGVAVAHKFSCPAYTISVI